MPNKCLFEVKKLHPTKNYAKTRYQHASLTYLQKQIRNVNYNQRLLPLPVGVLQICKFETFTLKTIRHTRPIYSFVHQSSFEHRRQVRWKYFFGSVFIRSSADFYLDVFRKRSPRRLNTLNSRGKLSCGTCLNIVPTCFCRFVKGKVPARAVGGCGLSWCDLKIPVK